MKKKKTYLIVTVAILLIVSTITTAGILSYVQPNTQQQETSDHYENLFEGKLTQSFNPLSTESSVSLSIDTINVDVGETGSSYVNMSDGENIALVSVNLSWDPTVVTVATVTYNEAVWDDFLGPGLAPYLDNDEGYLTFDAYNFTGGVSFDTWLACLEFEPVTGVSDTCTDVDFTEWMTANASYVVLDTMVINGSVCINSEDDTDPVTLSADTITIAQGETESNYINISDGEEIGLVSINLSWDPTVVTVATVTYNEAVWDDFLGPGLAPYLDNDEGYLTFDAYNFTGGVSFDTWLACLEFEPVTGVSDTCTDVDFTEWMTANASYVVLDTIVINGSVCIESSELIADAGGPYMGTVGESIQLDGSATGGNPPYTFDWDLDDDGEFDDATGKNPSHIWNTPGMKDIHLKVTDSTGCDIFDTDTTTVEIVEQDLGNITVRKTVKEDCCGEFAHYTTVDYSEYVTYKIDVYMNYSTNILSLSIKDNLPQLEGLSYNESCMYILDENDNYLPPTMYNHTYNNNYLYWNFTYVPANTHYRIFYKADAVACGPYENTVNLSAKIRPCCPALWAFDTDTSIVDVICPSGLWIEKDVSLDGIHWHNTGVEAVVGDLIWFRITVENLALEEYVFAVNVTDILPDHLAFDSFVTVDNNATVKTGNGWWQIFYPFIEDSKQIIFKARVINVGDDCNLVRASGHDNPMVSDTACVNVSGGMRVQKKVSTDNMTWMENVSVSIGDRVYWNTTVHYTSADQNMTLVRIVITDDLPEGLSYVTGSGMLLKSNGWSKLMDPEIDENKLTWNLTYVSQAWLRNGSWLSVLFATDVTGDVNGTLINWANVTAQQCDNVTVTDSDTAQIYIEEQQNHPPVITDPVPADNTKNVSVDATLEITVSDSDDDLLDVTFYDASDDGVIDTFSNVDPTDTLSADWNDLSYNTTYSWYVIAEDENNTVTSPEFSFRTEQAPDNRPPNMPTVVTPAHNTNGVSINPTLTVSVSDPDGDDLTVRFFDADTDLEIDVDTCPSPCSADGTWNGLLYGTSYEWYVTVTDEHDEEIVSSTWRFTTRIPDVELEIDIIGGFGISAEITNIGSDDAEDVSWSLHVTNRGIFSRIDEQIPESDDPIDVIESNGDVVAKKMNIKGFGPIRITATADCDAIDEPVVKTQNAFLIYSYVIIQN